MLIGKIGITAALVGEVLIPPEVRDELDHLRTPAPVRAWIAPMPWLRVQSSLPTDTDPMLTQLGPGERAAIALAAAVGADAVLVDDRASVAAAQRTNQLAESPQTPI